ncbi:VG15 protein [Streptomyces melanosporofaciens]
MATLVSDGGDADRQRRAQRGVTRLLVRDLRKLRRLILPSRMQATVPDWIEAVRALVGEYGNASASLAADYYDAQRVAAKVTGTFTVPLLDPPPDEQVDNSLRWATKDLWPRDPEDPATTEEQKAPLETRLEQAEKKAEQVAQKLVADQGRGTVREAVRRDRVAVGYARAAALGACAFCRLMASRGMVFKDANSAGRDANAKFSGNASVTKFHDNCHCGIIPVWKGQRFELSAHAAEWARIYQESAAPYPGQQLRRFRAALAEHDRRMGS